MHIRNLTSNQGTLGHSGFVESTMCAKHYDYIFTPQTYSRMCHVPFRGMFTSGKDREKQRGMY